MGQGIKEFGTSDAATEVLLHLLYIPAKLTGLSLRDLMSNKGTSAGAAFVKGVS